jgi:hypothetical protein
MSRSLLVRSLGAASVIIVAFLLLDHRKSSGEVAESAAGATAAEDRAPIQVECFAVVPIQSEARETVAELTAVAEQEFTLSFPSTDAREDVSGEFRFAAILDELQVLSWPEGHGADGWRFGVVDFFSHFHLGGPVPRGTVHSTFLQFTLVPEAPRSTARIPREPHRLTLVDAPFGWSVVPPTPFVPGERPIALEAVRLRLRTLCLMSGDGTPRPNPQYVRLALKEPRPDGRGWYSQSMLELPFRPQPRLGCVQFTLPLPHEARESSIVIGLTDGSEAESEQYLGIPAHVDISVD